MSCSPFKTKKVGYFVGSAFSRRAWELRRDCILLQIKVHDGCVEVFRARFERFLRAGNEGKREIKPKTHFGDHDKTQLSKNTKISTSVDVLDQAPEPIKDKDGNLLFQVEKIIDEQEQKDGTFMYVKWSGYDDTHNRSIHDTDK